MKIIIFYFAVFLSLSLTHNLHSQDDIKNYKQPEVSEGSSLLLSSNPLYDNSKGRSNNDIKTSYSLRIDLNTFYTKWKFNPKYNYAVNIFTSAFFDRNNFNGNIIDDRSLSVVNTNSHFNAQIDGGGSYYIKDNFYAGLYIRSQTYISSSSKPSFNLHLYPNIGYGKIVNAFIVSETSNFENILLKEKYLTQKLGKVDKAILNALLDKRNNTEFITNFKDNADIEFFSELDEALLNRGIISKPLNARTTMELYQALTNEKFIYFPRFKGFQVQAELQQNFIKHENGQLNNPILNFSTIYARPFNMKFGVVGSAFFSFPLGKPYDVSDFGFSFHSPLVIQDLQQLIKFTNGLKPDIYNLPFDTNYTFISGFKLTGYYYINNKAGITAAAVYLIGKYEFPTNSFYYSVDVSTSLIYNIIAKLSSYTTIGFRKNNFYDYSFFIYSGISYYIF